MTKQEHIDLYHELLGEALREEIEPQVVEGVLNAVYNTICLDLTSKKRRFDLSRKRFTGIAVTWDSAAEAYYSDYPAAIVPTINKEMIVSTIKGSGLLFYSSTEQVLRITSTLQSNDLNTHIRTILKRERIEYDNMESMTDEEIEDGSSPKPKIATVRMDLAIEFREFAETDEVYMPGGADYNIGQLALDMLRNEQIIDVKNG